MRRLINEKQLKRLISKHNKELDKHVEDSLADNTMLVMILKYHYTMEFLIDKIFESVLNKPELILKKSFSEKLKLFEAMGLDNDDEELRKMIFGLNAIRNKFAHNPKFNIWSNEGSKLIKNMGVTGKNNIDRLTKGFFYLSGYLRTMWSLHSIFPVMSLIDNLDVEDDLWLKGSQAEKEFSKEILKFRRSRKISNIITSAD